MHSYIFTGATQQQRNAEIQKLLTEWQVSPFDVVPLSTEDTSIGIADIRKFIGELQLKPRQSPLHVGLIEKGGLLTVAAQQALLKTLEEPPQLARIMISVSNISQLLPTIASRCQIITLHNDSAYSDEELEQSWKKLMALRTASMGEKLSLCATLGKTKEELSAFISCAIAATHKQLLANQTILEETKKNTELLHDLLTIKKYEETNANLSLIIEHIFLIGNDKNII